MDKNKILHMSDRIAMILMCVLMADIGIFGAGKVIFIGPLSFRHTLLLALALASVPLMLSKWKELLRNPFMWMIGVFFVWVGVTAIMGYMNGHRMSLIITDIKGFAFFIFLPVFLCVVRTRERVHTLMKTLIASSATLALIAVVCLIVYLCDRPALTAFSAYGYKIQFSRIGSITEHIPRLYFMSGLYMLCGCAFGIYFQVVEREKKHNWLYSVVTGLCLFAFLISYTRSVYLACAVTAVVTVISVLYKSDSVGRKNLLKHIAGAAAVCICLILVFSLIAGTNYLSYAFSRTAVSLENGTNDSTTPSDPSQPTDPSKEPWGEDEWKESYNKETAQSDALRLVTTRELWQNIKKSPVIGLGLGAEIPSRPDGLNEYIYLDVWSKTGIVGLILYFMPLFYMAWRVVKSKENDVSSANEKCVWIAALLGFMAYSYFNPYMNGSMGILLYCCVMSVTQPERKSLPEVSKN